YPLCDKTIAISTIPDADEARKGTLHFDTQTNIPPQSWGGIFVWVSTNLFVIPPYALEQERGHLVHRQTNLRHAVAFAHRHRLVFQRLEINGHTERRADLILAAIAAANIRHVVVLRDHHAFQAVMQALGRCDQLFLVLLQGQHGHLDGREPGIEVQHGAPLFILARWRLFLVSINQQVEEGAVYAPRGLDDPGNVALLGFGIGIAQILAANLAVTREVPILPPVDALPFLPAEHGLVFDIEGLFRVVRQFVRPMRAEAQAILVIKDAPVPLETLLFPVIKP